MCVGDVAPQNVTMRGFISIWLLATTIVVAMVLVSLGNIPLDMRAKKREEFVMEQYGKDMSAEELKEIIYSMPHSRDKDEVTKMSVIIFLFKRIASSYHH